MSFDLLAVFRRNRRAFRFPHAMNATTGVEDIQLTRGLHKVGDIHCLDYKRLRGIVEVQGLKVHI
jgi:hypothetical protein